MAELASSSPLRKAPVTDRSCISSSEIYIFTIIRIATRPFLILKMEITYIPDERSLNFIFTTFAHVACHGDMTRWRTVSTVRQNVDAVSGHFFNMPRAGLPSPSPSIISFLRHRSLLPQPTAASSCSHPVVPAPSKAMSQRTESSRE